MLVSGGNVLFYTAIEIDMKIIYDISIKESDAILSNTDSLCLLVHHIWFQIQIKLPDETADLPLPPLLKFYDKFEATAPLQG